jgi:hypothetical protein
MYLFPSSDEGGGDIYSVPLNIGNLSHSLFLILECCSLTSMSHNALSQLNYISPLTYHLFILD